MSKLYLWMGQKIGETEYKRNAGGDMSFLICGLWPGWSFAQFWWQNTKIGVLPNSDEKCQTSKDKPEFWESAKNSLTLLKPISGQV